MNEQDIRLTFEFMHGNDSKSVFEVSGIGTEQSSKLVETGNNVPSADFGI